MDDFPLWAKVPIWIIVGGSAIYAIVAIVVNAIN
jgi:hypothetical protein